MREESRGGHSRLDHPRYDDYWSENNIVISCENGEMELEAHPVVKSEGLIELIEARQEAERV
jgi:succinate dehydrogenase/fumarate reductase flavoprotein subunit